MKGVSRGLLLTLLLTTLAGALGALCTVHYLQSKRTPASLHEFVHKEIRLTDDQETQLARLEQDFAVRRKVREAELRAANAELAAAIQARHEYSPEVQASVERFHHAMGELQKETIVHVLAMRQVLTPEQARKFDARVAEALTQPAP
ncbi:periplasmic heavy metal sensor [Phenylobacterium sp. J426]|uniref:Spy/CpxP family protein refolding chaperone n=1 Tax=Phenylobacterium sp. J426 TaxID=2898439 RepID=UPI002151820E|nr:periplasmic heavy metal sensor [Phenylobacterium sp. J426]MCR5872776.1 periplasmic heavy metal sensor [Phenylobacterium sp. J426]